MAAPPEIMLKVRAVRIFGDTTEVMATVDSRGGSPTDLRAEEETCPVPSKDCTRYGRSTGQSVEVTPSMASQPSPWGEIVMAGAAGVPSAIMKYVRSG
jgi:hypothetical protein